MRCDVMLLLLLLFLRHQNKVQILTRNMKHSKPIEWCQHRVEPSRAVLLLQSTIFGQLLWYSLLELIMHPDLCGKFKAPLSMTQLIFGYVQNVHCTKPKHWTMQLNDLMKSYPGIDCNAISFYLCVYVCKSVDSLERNNWWPCLIEVKKRKRKRTILCAQFIRAWRTEFAIITWSCVAVKWWDFQPA